MDFISQIAVGGNSSIGASNGGNGIDSLMYIEMLMIQEQDAQLKDLGNKIKGFSEVKKAYRKEIEYLNTLLTKDSVNKKGKPYKKDKEYIEVTDSELNKINSLTGFTFDQQARQIKPTTLSDFQTITGNKVERSHEQTTNRTIEKDKIERLIEILSEKKDDVTEQSELTNMAVQSATNQRKSCIETISNLISKSNEAVSTIVRNIK